MSAWSARWHWLENFAMFENASYLYFEDVNWGLLRLWGERRGLDVLDVGCGYATTSQFLKNNRVTGIESSAEAVNVARTRIARVVQRDLQDFDGVAGELGETKFDAIIFADVLEHLAWPIGVLKQHLAGKFEYEETGVLDHTHLRFFTRRSALRMLDAAGLKPLRRTYNPGLVRPFVPLVKRMLGGGEPGSILESKPYKLYLKTVHPIESAFARLWPGMLAFQMIFEAARK